MFTLTGQDRHGIAIEVKEATKQGYAECRVGIDSVNFSMPNSKTRRGRVGQEIANTLDTSCNQGIGVTVTVIEAMARKLGQHRKEEQR